MTTQALYTQIQIEHLSSIRYINRIDHHLKLVTSVQVRSNPDHNLQLAVLFVDIFFDDQKIDDVSFNLHEYEYEEIIEVAKNIADNDFILRTVDTILAGEVE